MAQKSNPGTQKIKSEERAERLSVALRANLARRKAQARARKTPATKSSDKSETE